MHCYNEESTIFVHICYWRHCQEVDTLEINILHFRKVSPPQPLLPPLQVSMLQFLLIANVIAPYLLC